MVKIGKFFKQYRLILKRLLITILFLFLFRMGALITMPGITVQDFAGTDQNNFLNLWSMLGGGVLNKMSFFALGISPFITASIIVQLLSSGLVPPLTRIMKQGRAGERKVNFITKIIMIPIGYLQALGTIKALSNSNLITVRWDFIDGYQDPMFYYFLCPIVLLAGSMVTLLIAHLINEKGIGQGVSIIIFTGILISLPQNIEQTVKQLFFTGESVNHFFNAMRFIVYISALILLITFIIWLNNSQRQIPIQQTGVGLRLENQKITHLPVKVNPAGVIPVIFSSTLISIFQSIATLINNPDNGFTKFVNQYMSYQSWSGIMIFASLTFLFVLIYSRILFNTQNIAESFAKNGTYLIGIKSGDTTENYLNRLLTRLSFFGGFALAFLAIFALIFQKFVFPDFPQGNFVINGTSLLILIMIGQSLIKQLQNFKTQLYYVNLRSTKGDDFSW